MSNGSKSLVRWLWIRWQNGFKFDAKTALNFLIKWLWIRWHCTGFDLTPDEDLKNGKCWKHRFKVRNVFQLLKYCVHGQICLEVVQGLRDELGYIFNFFWYNFVSEIAFVLVASLSLIQGRTNGQSGVKSAFSIHVKFAAENGHWLSDKVVFDSHTDVSTIEC